MRALLAASLAGWISVAVHAQTQVGQLLLGGVLVLNKALRQGCSQVATLSPFTGISVCTPFNVSPGSALSQATLLSQATILQL